MINVSEARALMPQIIHDKKEEREFFDRVEKVITEAAERGENYAFISVDLHERHAYLPKLHKEYGYEVGYTGECSYEVGKGEHYRYHIYWGEQYDKIFRYEMS